MARLGQLLVRGLHVAHAGRALQRLLGFGQRRLHFGLIGGLHLFATVLQHLLDVVDQRIEAVARLDLLALLLVLGGVRLGFLGHLLDFVLAQAGARCDGDARVLAGGVVLRRHVQNAVGIDVERDLDLRHAARRRRNSRQLELAQRAVLRRHRPLALQHVHFDFGLAVGRRRERLRLLGRNRGVARNHRRRHAAQRLDRQRQRRHVEQQQVLDLARQHARLHRRADGHHFIGVHAAMGLFAEQLLHQFLDLGHARLAAHQDHFVDVAGLHAGIGHGLLARLERTLEQVPHQLLQLGAGQLAHQVLGPGRVGRNERQVDLRLHRGRELDLGLFRRVLQALQGHLVALRAQVETLFLLELGNQPVHDPLVEVVAAQVGVAVGRLHLDDAFADFENGNIERAAAEVVHGDGLVLLLVEPVGQRGRGRLVDDALHVQTGDLAGVLGGLALRVVKVGRHRDHGLR